MANEKDPKEEGAAATESAAPMDTDWRAKLTPEQYAVTREAGKDSRYLPLRMLRQPALQLEYEIRFGNRLAQLLRAHRSFGHSRQDRRQPRHGAYGGLL